jgi:peptide/nickel transport system substrate-binding protein
LVQELINADFEKLEIIPVLAKERPTFTPIEGSDLVEMNFEIRKEAEWDNGTPITGEDIAFSLKTIIVPQTNCPHKKPYFEYIKDIVIDEENPKKFKFIISPYMLAEAVMSDLHIIPSYFYDKENVLKDYSIKMLNDTSNRAALEADEKLIAFANTFNSNELNRKLAGSGPYEIEEWKANERIVLKRKEDWWGNNVSSSNANQWLRAYPDNIIYEIIPDATTTFTALKSGRINTMYAINPKTYVEECKTDAFAEDFHTGEPWQFTYEFIGFNLTNPKFQDVKTRRALSHLMNVDELIKTACDGYGQPVASFSHPSKKEFLNKNVKPYEFSLEKAKALLTEAGWKDSDNDGILDKEIEGTLTPFKIRMIANKENDRRLKTGELFKDAAKQVGIEVDFQSYVWKNYIGYFVGGDFDLYTLAWSSSPFESDPKQIWHSSSIGGSNYISYSNPEVDKLIDEMRLEVEKKDRLPYYHKIHQIIHDDAPVIFTIAQKERIAVSKIFDNVFFTGMKPGFWAAGFTKK